MCLYPLLIIKKYHLEKSLCEANTDGGIDRQSPDEISIPTPPDADIELNFKNPIITEVPLTLKTKGAGDDATAQASTNEVEINIPYGSSNIDLELVFQTSTVTLKGGAIDELTALTAQRLTARPLPRIPISSLM